jgi:hypothetical protein
MPLDDREQRILEEIERQFYEEDPKLAEAVRSTTLASVSSRQLKWALLTLVIGLGLMLGFYTHYVPVALLGFIVMVLSVAWIAAIVQRRSGVGGKPGSGMMSRLSRRWHRRG